MKKKWSLFVLLVVSINIFSQKNADRDSADFYFDLAVKAEHKKRSPLMSKAVHFAEKTQDSKVIANFLIKEAHIQYYEDLVDASFATLRKASQQDFTKKSPYFQSRIKIIRSDNFQKIGLDSLSLQESKDVLGLLDYNTKDIGEQQMLLRSIGRLATYYYDHKDKKRYEKYFSQYESFLKKLNRKDFIPEYESYYFNKATLLIEKKSFDSAFYYLRQGENFQYSLGDKTLSYYYNYLFGEYYYNIKAYQKALKYYSLCIEQMEQKDILEEEYFDAYLKAANASGKLGNKKDQIKYLDAYAKLKNKLSKAKAKAVNTAVKNLVDEKEEKHLSFESKIITGIAVLICIVILLGFYIHRIQKKRKSLIAENEKQILEKESMVSMIENERQLSKQKSKDALEDILELAKKNDPSFYVKFQNLFPNFQKRLTEFSQDLTSTELELLAYVFLNINSKDIADYTFKSIRTVQNRKSALRKKLKIDSNLDFHVWIKDIVAKSDL